MSNNLRKGALSSILLVVDGIAKKLVGLVSTLILARVLLPEDFGIIAIASLMVNFILVLSDAGSKVYLLRVDNLDSDKVNTSWTINFILKSTVSIIMIIGSFYIDDFYGDPRITPILISLTVVFFFNSFENPGLAFLRRDQNYTKIVKLTVTTKIISVIFAVTAALILKNYWALVIAQATSAFFMIVGSYIICPTKPKFMLKNTREQWQFSGWMIPQALFGYFRSHLATFIVSSSFGQAVLGSFQTMKYIAFIPSSFIIQPIGEPFLVELANSKGTSGYFAKQFKASFILLMLVALPISSVMYFNHGLVTALILGDNWTDYSYLMSAFGLLIPAYVMLQHGTRALLVYGKTKQMFFYDCIAFVSIYGVLFAHGMDEIKSFSFLLVGMENLLAGLYFLFILLRYTGLKSTLTFVVSIIPLIIGTIGGHLFSVYIRIDEVNIFVDLLLVTFSNTVAFFLIIFCLYIMGFKKFSEWEYLISLLLRIVNPVLSIFKHKDGHNIK